MGGLPAFRGKNSIRPLHRKACRDDPHHNGCNCITGEDPKNRWSRRFPQFRNLEVVLEVHPLPARPIAMTHAVRHFKAAQSL